MVLTVISVAFSSYLLVRGVNFYIETHDILEECTADWSSHFPCHYLKLWIKYHGQANIYDTSCFIKVFSIFLIALTTQILVRKTIQRELNCLLSLWAFRLIYRGDISQVNLLPRCTWKPNKNIFPSK